MDIPVEALSKEALEGVIREFVLREGTDYGHSEYSLESKVDRVRAQLTENTAKIVFDPETETFDIVRVRG